MEKIKKIISIDGARSHRNGILPYVPYSVSSNTIMAVDGTSENGNFGGFPCDFVVWNGWTEDSIFGKDLGFEKKELSRLRYLDVIRRYNYTQEQLRKGLYVKKYLVSEKDITSIECSTAVTEEDKVTYETKSSFKFKPDYEEIDAIGMYDSVPLDIEYFVENNGLYSFVFPDTYSQYMGIEESARTEEEQALVDKVDNVLSAISANTYAVLIPNYDTVMQYDRMWEEWWEEWQTLNESGSVVDLREEAFDNLYNFNECSGGSCFFKFCREIDKYVLGRVEVVGSGLTGVKVPAFVFYTNYYSQKKWFESFSAATMDAYHKDDEKSLALVREWEDRGGGAFYDFLSGITPVYPKYGGLSKGEGIYFEYDAPRYELETLIVNDTDEEWIYTPYEYSVVGYQMYGVVKDYIAPEEGIGSALTPHFVSFSSAETPHVDSKIDTLLSDNAVYINEDVVGVFDEFDENGGKTFVVKYQTGNVVTTTVCESGYGFSYIETTDKDGNPYTVEKEYKIPVSRGEGITGAIPSCSQYEWTFAISAISSSLTIEEMGENELVYDGQGRLSAETMAWSEISTVTYGWWGANEYDGTAVLRCGDGEQVPSDKNGTVSAAKKYRNATILSCAPSIIGTYQHGDTYYIRARYKNGARGRQDILSKPEEISSMKMPYVVGEKMNITSWPDSSVTFDMVIDTAATESSMTINYALGISSAATEEEVQGNISGTGIHYQEEIPYRPCNVDYVAIDGVYMAELYYDLLDFSAVSETVYSDEYRLSRTTHKARLTGMEVGTQWTPSGAQTTFLVTKENMDGLQEIPRQSLNAVYDRGNAAAWEYHFKLAECNTMSDLEQYGNNAFNL